ncbi:MAG: GNAT family N-acetyltransferase [Planctomycetia bacterium]|jgi:predicted GNAT family N-acyltransferase
MDVKIFSTAEPAYRDSLELRNRVLWGAVGLDIFKADLSDEVDQLHFGLFEGKQLLACVILKNLGEGSAKLRQMAVVKTLQNRGLGTQLIQGMEALAKERGIKSIEMAAQMRAKGFYEKVGYNAEGPIFQEVGIDHIKMIKSL